MSASSHPTADQLRAFTTGQASAEAQADVTAHLDECAACCTRLDELFASDVLLARIQSAAQPESRIEVAPLQRRRAAEALHRWHAPPAHATVCRADTSTAGLDSTLSPFSATSASGPGLPRQSGEYEILEELGRGGMGVVFKARHLTLNRLVALKMLHRGALAEGEQLARFREEAKVVARLQHPGIVQIHEVGTLEGQPYLALEYVPGRSLDRQLAGTPQPPRDAAALLIPLAQAIQAAHQQGVLHRDLKPANILLAQKSETRNTKSETNLKDQNRKSKTPPPAVSEFSASDFGFVSDLAFRISDFQPKVTDFGLAKPFDVESEQTKSGVVVGTPQYMAPEQAAGKKQLGPTADVYSLGTILYEMLTGRPPFRGPTAYDTMKQLSTEEPVPPRRLQPGTPRDLDTICLKCLQKEPAKRYHTAAELADDLQRFQNGEPIQARPVHRLERTWRWCRRNPVVAGLTAAICLLLVGAGIGGWLLAAWALAAQATAEHERDAAQKERQRAAENFTQARHAVDETFLLCRDDPLFQGAAMGQQRRRLLSKALPFYQAFLRQQGDASDLKADHANVLHRLAYSYHEVGPSEKAQPTCSQALAIYRQLVKDHPQSAVYWEYLAQTWNTMALIEQTQGNPAAAFASLQQAQDCAARLVLLSPLVVKHQLLKAQFASNVGFVQRHRGLSQEAIASFKIARRTLEELLVDAPDDSAYQSYLANTCEMLGDIYMRQGTVAEMVDCYTTSRRLREQLFAAHPEDEKRALDLGSSCCNLGLVLRQVGPPHLALPHLARAVLVLGALVRNQPLHAQARKFLRNSCHERALALEQLGRPAAAYVDCQRSFAAARFLPDPGPGPHDVMARVLPWAQSETASLTASLADMAAPGHGVASVLHGLVPKLFRIAPEPE